MNIVDLSFFQLFFLKFDELCSKQYLHQFLSITELKVLFVFDVEINQRTLYKNFTTPVLPCAFSTLLLSANCAHYTLIIPSVNKLFITFVLFVLDMYCDCVTTFTHTQNNPTMSASTWYTHTVLLLFRYICTHRNCYQQFISHDSITGISRDFNMIETSMSKGQMEIVVVRCPDCIDTKRPFFTTIW